MDTKPRTDPLDFGPACREVAGLLDTITDDQLTEPTPCPAYTVADLLAHLTGLTVAFRDAARKDLGPTTDTPPSPAALPPLAADWREVLPRQLDGLAAAWRSPTAWEGDTRVGGVDLPGAAIGLFGLNEVLVHGWDLARSTGQAYAPDERSLRALRGMLAAGAAGNADSPFGPPVGVPGDAPLLDRVLGLTGRRPDWRPDN
ncbi:TIGR03086 family metal-binding protein [Streptomyces sp. NPDC051569]|uniref:TIGR03086 family metal-binding protein n=1 Tax=Streptomyces sp. NPDC051569 TaxID=3365661 RepID=UPI0037B00E40